MILDIRGASYIEAFTQLRDATNLLTHNEEILVFVAAHEQEKCMIIKGFVEILLGCKATIKETSGHYIIHVIHELHDGVSAKDQTNTKTAGIKYV